MSFDMNKLNINEEEIVNEFLEWAKINAPSKKEKPIADLIVIELKKLGFSIEFDTAHKKFDGNCGNLIAYWRGTNESIPPLFLSTHMDTVLPTEGLSPVIKDGVIYSDGNTILGADDRSALTGYLEAIKYIQKNNIPCGPIELILTVNEQQGLKGSRYLDYTKVKSKFGYVFDAGGNVGQIINQGVYVYIFHIKIRGKSAHISGNPDEGISAFVIAAHILIELKNGRINDNTLSNIGLIKGGELTSIIPGEVKLTGEVRSFSKDEVDIQIQKMFNIATEIAAEHGGSVEKSIEKKYNGFKVNSDNILVKNATDAANNLEIKPFLTRASGGADTMYYNENGLTCITLGNGFRNVHTYQENISIENLVNIMKYTVSLIQSWYNTHQK